MVQGTIPLLVCFIECVLFGGTMYGWPSLVYVLKQEGVYHHLCPLEFPANQTGDRVVANTSVRGRPTLIQTSEWPVVTSSPMVTTSHDTRREGRHDHRYDLPCEPQDHHLALTFILCVLMQGVSSFPLGRLFDWAGLRSTRLLGCFVGFAGYSMLAFTHEGEASWLIYVASSLCGISMTIIVMTNCYVAQLAGSRTATVVALYNGAVMASPAVLLIIKLLYDAGVSRTTTMTIFSFTWIVVVINTCVLLPKYKIPVLEADGHPLRRDGHPLRQDQGPVTSSPPAASPDSATELRYIPTNTAIVDAHSTYIPEYELLWSRGLLQESEPVEVELSEVGGSSGQSDPPPTSANTANTTGDSRKHWATYIRSSVFWLFLYWFAALHLRAQVFISTFNTWVYTLVKGDAQQVSHFTNVYGFISVSSIVISPVSGIIMDIRRKRLKVNERYGLLGAMAAAPSLTITTSVAILVSMLTLLKVEWCIYVTIAAFTILMVFLYPTGIAFIGQTWPSCHYGTLFGATVTVLGVVSFLQYPFVIWAGSTARGDLPMNTVLLFTAVLTFLHPGNIFFQYRKRKSQNGNASLSDSALSRRAQE